MRSGRLIFWAECRPDFYFSDRLPSALGSGTDVIGVYLSVQVFPDKVAYDREDHHESRLADAQKGDQEDYQPRDQSPPLFVGPGGHLSFLSLRSGSLYRDFDVFDGDALLLENPPDRSEEHTSELQSHSALVCRLLLEKKKTPRTSPDSVLAYARLEPVGGG